MKKVVSKQAKKASKLAKAQNKQNKFITVKNAEGDPDTTAEIVIQNKINYEPKVSVIIPVYNVEEYLRECLDSVINQTLKEIEIICVDDGSTDSSLEILKEYAKKDNRITVMKQENLHAGVARNAGLAVARGEYLSFLDSDDFFELNMLEEMSQKADNDGSDIIICNYDYFDDITKDFKKSYSYNDKHISASPFVPISEKDYLYFISTPNAWTKLFKKELIDRKQIFFENFKSCNDITFVNTSLSLADKISVTNSAYIHYRINSGINTSTNREQKCLSIIFAMKKLQQNLQKNDIYSHYKKIFETQLLVRAKSEVLKANSELKKEFLRKFSQNFEKELYDKLELSLAPKVSIIIPIYNAELYLEECLNSVINQTLRELEIICINDASTDNSLKILEEFAKKDGRIKIINNEKNTGAPGAVKNIGIKCATGEYVGFVDSDDWVDNNYFEELYKAAKKNNADIGQIKNIEMFSEKNNKIVSFDTNGKKILVLPEEKELIMKISSSNWSKIFNLNFIKNNNIECYNHFSTAEDNLFSMIAMCCANKIAITSNTKYHYRKYEGSVTGRKRTIKHFNIFDIYYEIDNYISKNFKDYEKEAYLQAMNERKKNDFKWFLSSIDDMYIDDFKIKLKQKFPIVYYYLFPNKIPIILSSDNNYAPFMFVTMISILENAKTNTIYDFYLMVPSAFSKQNEKMILDLKNKYKCDIRFIDMKNAFSYLTMRISHITSPTYYRLLAGDLLPKEYDKCIYLDVDICVCKDLSELFNIDMKNNYVAGVVAAGYYFNEQANCKRLNLPSMKQYVNAGVLLMNLKNIRENNLTKKFLELSKKNYSSQDQDVINVACYGKIITLAPKYNAMVGRLKENDIRLRDLYSEKDIQEAKTNPCIIHYADKIKPWNDPSVYMSRYWWKYASKTGLFFNDYCNNLKTWYKRVSKKDLNLDNPKTFNEKIQWMKLYDSTPLKTRLADKYLVRDWVKDRIGEEYLIPLLGVYDKFEEIDFDKLPNKFVIKCNHGCAYNIIVKDKSKLDLADVKAKLDKWMNENFAFHAGCELHYRDIQPKIIVEKFIENKKSGGDLYDYKFWCFDGKVYYVQFLSERNLDGLKMAFYDKDWNKQHFVYSHPLDKKNIQKPDNLQKMIKLAEKLSKGFNHVRVDFYRLDDGTIYFGEMTFTSASGNCKWNDEKINKKFGDLIKLPKLAYNIDTGEYYKLPKNKKKVETNNKTSILKSYLLLPYYLLKIQHMKRVLDKKPSRLFSITKYGNKKVYRILGLKFAFNNFKKDVIDNQEKILKMLSDIQTRQKKLEEKYSSLEKIVKK